MREKSERYQLERDEAGAKLGTLEGQVGGLSKLVTQLRSVRNNATDESDREV